MNKLRLLAVLFLAAAACSDKGLYDDAVKAFEKHSWQEHPAGEVRALLEAKGFAGLASLDRHAVLIPARRRVRQRSGKTPLSAGLLAGYRQGSIYLLKVFQNSPAAAAGFRDGDRVTAIDGQAPTPQAVAEHMNDSFGFSLKTERALPKPALTEAQLKREEFYFPLIFGFYEPASGVAYVKIGLLVQGSSATVASGLESLASLGARKVVLDLRDSLGGMPEEAAGLLGAFAPKAGPVLELKSRHPGYSRVFEARGRGKFADMKVAVLTDGGTAMAAEVFAQALRELAGARLVGAPTAGNVSVVRTFGLGRGVKGLELTVARLLPPSGQDLEGKGAAPDEPVAVTETQAKDLREAWGASSETALLGDRAYARAVELLAK